MNQKTPNDKKTNPHEGHRARLRARAMKEGLRTFEPHQVLELLLFYVIPRRDTNVIAHSLLNRFRSVTQVMDAEYEELLKIDGISDNAATFIKLIPQIARIYLLGKQENLTVFKSVSEIGNYLYSYYISEKKEIPVLLLFDESRRLLCDPIELVEGGINVAAVTNREIVQYALQYEASSIVLAHNHPNGDATPSSEDVLFTQNLRNMLNMMGINLIEHIIVGTGRFCCVSEMDTGTQWIDDSHSSNLD